MNRVEVVRTEIDAILLNRENISGRPDGYIHLYGVAQFCGVLALKRGLDVELCTIIGLLHDIYTYKFEYVKEHAFLGSIEAGNLLKDVELFNNEEIELVRTAIANHSDKKTKDDKYSELLKDADMLQNSIYDDVFEARHKKRLKKLLKSMGIKIKIKKVKNAKAKPVEIL